MSQWPGSAMTEVLFVFLLAALVVGALIELAQLIGRLTRQMLVRRRAHSALAGDWWSRFEEELRAFTGGVPARARDRPPERGRQAGAGGENR